LRLLTKREKTWFFPLCGYQPKINKLIFLFSLTSRLVLLLSPEAFQQSKALFGGLFFAFRLPLTPALSLWERVRVRA
jgi:hypothetical protein